MAIEPVPLQNNPNVELIDGMYYDTMVEQIIGYIFHDDYDDPNFDEAFNIIIKRYVKEDSPYLIASYAGKRREHAGSVHFLMVFGLDFDVINYGSCRWPKNGFENMEEATCAVSIMYDGTEHQTDYFPGVSINQAALGALLQYAREKAITYYNQPGLDFDGSEDTSPPSIN